MIKKNTLEMVFTSITTIIPLSHCLKNMGYCWAPLKIVNCLQSFPLMNILYNCRMMDFKFLEMAL